MNEAIFRFFNNFALQSEFLDAVIIFFTDNLGLLLIAGLLIFLFAEKGLSSRSEAKRGETLGSKKSFLARDIFVIFAVALFAWIISKIIRVFYFSPRPFEVLDNVNLLFEHGTGDSLPSGHATFYSALATSFYFYHKYLAIIYIAGALLIGTSRIIAGIHWPLDILAGYALGGAIGYLAYKLLTRR